MKMTCVELVRKPLTINISEYKSFMEMEKGDLSVSTQEHGNPPRGQRNKNNMHLVYENESQKREIDIYVIDCAKSPDDMEMINFAYAMDNQGKDSKDIKPYITQFNEEAKATQLYYKAEDRIIVHASGVNTIAEELWAYIQKLNVGKLLKE